MPYGLPWYEPWLWIWAVGAVLILIPAWILTDESGADAIFIAVIWPFLFAGLLLLGVAAAIEETARYLVDRLEGGGDG